MSNWRVAPKIGSGGRILAELKKVRPNGATPLSEAVGLAVDLLRRLGEPGIVVLVTDGLENCGDDACQLARNIKGRRSRYPRARHRIFIFTAAPLKPSAAWPKPRADRSSPQHRLTDCAEPCASY